MKMKTDNSTPAVLDSMQQPPVITYNLKDRGRQHTGQPRNFDVQAICDSVNSPATQETVKSRGMLGYFGHKIRLLAGLEPAESMVIGGKYNEIEPAIITTDIKAMPDGTISHKTEFLDTEPGRKAARLYANKVGGFSSVIDKANRLIGFDFVLQPNYNGNRGFSLDSADGLVFDSVLAEAQEEEETGLIDVVEQKNAEISAIQASFDSLLAENEDLLSMLASKNATLEDASSVMPIAVSLDSAERIKRDTDLFRQTAKLPGFIEPAAEKDKQHDQTYNKFLNRIGF
jgi:hypothetical protein